MEYVYREPPSGTPDIPEKPNRGYRSYDWPRAIKEANLHSHGWIYFSDEIHKTKMSTISRYAYDWAKENGYRLTRRCEPRAILYAKELWLKFDRREQS